MEHPDRLGGHSPVLFLALAFPPDPITGAARPGRFYKYLPQFGYRPEVIALRNPAQPEPDAAVHRLPLENPGRGDRMALAAGNWIQRHFLPYADSIPWSTVAFRQGDRLFRAGGARPILSTSPPIGTHVAALRLKQRWNVPWIADFRDPLLGNPFRNRRWFFPFDPMLERAIFRSADAIIANTDTLADMWRARYPQWERKIEVIWNGFDPRQPIAAEPLPERPYRVLTHAGSLYGGRHPVLLLRAIERLIAAGRLDPATLRLRFIGTVDAGLIERHQAAFDTLSARGCLEVNGKTVSPQEATYASATSDYLLLLDLNESNMNVQVPAKIFEYVRIGRPILAFTATNSPVERILSGSEVLFRAISPAAPEEQIDRTVLEFLTLPTEPRDPGPWFTSHFDGIAQTEKLAGILRRISGR